MGQIYPGNEGETLCNVCHGKSREHRPGPDVGVDTIKAENDKESLIIDSHIFFYVFNWIFCTIYLLFGLFIGHILFI